MFQACFIISIVVSAELKSTLRNSSHLSASSRRPEDVKMLRMLVLQI